MEDKSLKIACEMYADLAITVMDYLESLPEDQLDNDPLLARVVDVLTTQDDLMAQAYQIENIDGSLEYSDEATDINTRKVLNAIARIQEGSPSEQVPV